MFRLFILSVLILASRCEEEFENSTAICTRCTCSTTGTGIVYTINCLGQEMHQVIANWPQELSNKQTLKATFSYNNITTLKTLPATNASLEVVFSHCNIKYLYPGIFSATINVKLADFSHNQLVAEEISSEKLKGAYNNKIYEPLALENLNLAYNQIHSLNKNLFEHLPNLTHLNLEGNDFTVLDLHTQLAISSVKGLQSLNLANNELTELVGSAIETLTNLTDLDISRNLLDFVPYSLANLKTLRTLNISNNPIMELDSNSFLGLQKLMDLTANNLTRLKFVNANTFGAVPLLRKLSLCDNYQLLDIDREAFGTNQSLEELYLNNNLLYRLDYKLLNWSKLRIFELRENPLDCSCDLYNITNALSKQITQNEDGPFCIHPKTKNPLQVYNLKSDICTFKASVGAARITVEYHFSVIRIFLVTLSVLVTFGTFFAALIVYMRLRRHQRNVNYPFASQVHYNHLSGAPRL